MCFVCGFWSLRHGCRAVGDAPHFSAPLPHFSASAWWGRHMKCPPPHFFACEIPDFKPIFNRLLPKCVCLRGSAPHPAGELTAPRPPGGKVWVTHRSFGQMPPKMNPPPFKVLATGLGRHIPRFRYRTGRMVCL